MNPDVLKAMKLIKELEVLAKDNPHATALLKQKKKQLEALTGTVSKEVQKKIIDAAKAVAPNLESAPAVERANALMAVDEFRAETVTPKYDNISQAELLLGLEARINDPEGVDQSSLNLCGPAAYCVLWAKHDPEGYAKAAIDLYKKGSYTYNGKTITANTDTFDQTPLAGMSKIDWMMLSAIRHSENAFYDYNPKNDRGTAAFTTHWEMTAWISNIVGIGENRDSSPTISSVNSAINSGKTVVLLVDWGQLSKNIKKKGKEGSKKSGKPDSLINSWTGNHYIIMTKPITVNGNQITFEIWTWASRRTITLQKEYFAIAAKDAFIVDDHER
ncbi:MAG: hypothetical protein JKY03_05870 [Aureispira sp.]|nr:hypothetical protein [Aureispira sp.]